jgi:hypothetical protein
VDSEPATRRGSRQRCLDWLPMRYAHLSPDVKRDAVRVLDSLPAGNSTSAVEQVWSREGGKEETPRSPGGLDGAGRGI